MTKICTEACKSKRNGVVILMSDNKSINAMQLDSNMQIETNEKSLYWHSPLKPPFQIAGFGWLQGEGRYRRLPEKPAWELPQAVNLLANCTSGGQIRFTTDAISFSVKVKLKGAADMYHMPATGQCGFDCYLGGPGEQMYYGTTKYDHQLAEYESVLFANLNRETRDITLNFPLYQGVDELWIGLDPAAQLFPPPVYESKKKVIVYGTSITQGACASRPGMSYTNILSRRFNIEFLNLGFSGSGKGEPELAHLLAEIEDPACLILDYEANVSTELLQQTLPNFIAIYRERHRTTPILVISRITHAKERFEAQMAKDRADRKQIAKRTVEERRERNDANIYFCDGSHLLGEEAQECTVDGSHPTDLGFLRMADGLTPILQQILGQTKENSFDPQSTKDDLGNI
ncbi:SGNH/GDSL hydrolase family protein [Paenibacillus aceris]|uniref:Lysophospholipase L1-like esterase n=1 Tax=Paenibacillus aceris TaxID=869555 RepID=A0ABS4I0P1_9BACL|nr:SGNH/GDSL hydrolase family protein [Paenibacillus aceris]MBP1964483.1 lysophospholipase L1-like esterase [Paenibacillus aceris]